MHLRDRTRVSGARAGGGMEKPPAETTRRPAPRYSGWEAAASMCGPAGGRHRSGKRRAHRFSDGPINSSVRHDLCGCMFRS